MRAVILTIIFGLALAGCGSSPTATSPAAPTTPAKPLGTLSGTVRATTGESLGGARVEILDGPNVGQATIANDVGSYTLANLSQTQSEVSIRASAEGFQARTLSLIISAGSMAGFDFALQTEGYALLRATGTGILTPTGPDSASVAAVVVNSGTTCATSISGTTDIYYQDFTTIATLQWSAPGVTIPAGASATLTVGQLSGQQLKDARAGGYYNVTFKFTSGC